MFKFLSVSAFAFVLGIATFATPAHATFNVCQIVPQLCQPPVTDVCPNIEGNQLIVPEGKEIVDGQCVDIVIPPTDVCANLEGVQETVPEGLILDGENCVEPEEPTDYCPTLEGVQAIDEDCPSEEVPPVIVPDEPEEHEKACKKPGDVKGIAATTGVASDGIVELDWKHVRNGDRVEIQFSLDSIFSTLEKHTRVKTDDDSHYRLHVPQDGLWHIRVRGRNSDDQQCKDSWEYLRPVQS